MEKWSKKLSLALLGAGLLAFAPSANADNCNDSCCDMNACGFDLGIDFLWWKPCSDDRGYSISHHNHGEHDDHYKLEGICSDWEPGVRVTVGVPDFYCDWNLGVSYIYIGNDNSSTDHEHVYREGFNHVKASDDFNYHDWDVLFSYELCSNKCHHFSPFFGVAGIYLDQNASVNFANLVEGDHSSSDFSTSSSNPDSLYDNVKWNSDFWGVGLKAGTDYQYRLSDCLRFYSNGAISILAGEASSSVERNYSTYVEDTLGVRTYTNHKQKFTGEGCCHMVPGLRLGVGLLWDYSVCETDFAVKLGYDFVHWHNVPAQERFFDGDLETVPGHHDRDLNFHGLSLGVNMSF